MDHELAPYSDFEKLRFARPAPWVLRVTIDNAEKMNAIGNQLASELETIWPVIDSDPATRAAIITGAGRAFSSGGSFEAMPTERQRDHLDQFCYDFGNTRALIEAMITMRKPLISAINGPAVGAGLAIALLADIPIAAKTAKLFDGHLRIGVVPGDHAAMIWPILCGLAKSKYHLLTNEPVTGEQAAAMNLIALAVESDELQDKAVEVAVKLAATAPKALMMTKYLLNHFLRQNQTIFDLSAAFEMINFGSNEANEAMRALKENKTPNFPPSIGVFR